MTLVQLEYVLVVAESKNFTLAAEKAFVTQPTLSMQIQKLEKELNVEIFDRSTHPISITSIGKQVIEQAKEIINETRRMNDVINEHKGSLLGEFNIGVIPTILPTLIPLIYNNFKNKFPEALLTFKELKTEDIIQQLRDNQLDFGIAVTPLQQKEIVENVLYYEPMVGFVPPNHRLAPQKQINEQDLELDDLLLLEEGHCFRNNVLSICEPFQSKSRHLTVDSGNFKTMINLSKEGLGMTILPVLEAEDLSTNDQKYIKNFVSPPPTREVSMLYHHSQLKLNFAEKFKKMVRAVVRGKIFLESDNRTFPALKMKLG